MKLLPSILPALTLAALCFASGSSLAQQSGIGRLAGKWAVDVARLPIPPEFRPKSVTVTFTEAPGGRLSTRVEVVDGSGGINFAESVAALDGTPVPVKGNLEADTAAASMPAPGVLIMQLSRSGVPGSTRVYTLTADPKSMTETAANFGDDGRPFMRINHFSRIE